VWPFQTACGINYYFQFRIITVLSTYTLMYPLGDFNFR